MLPLFVRQQPWIIVIYPKPRAEEPLEVVIPQLQEPVNMRVMPEHGRQIPIVVFVPLMITKTVIAKTLGGITPVMTEKINMPNANMVVQMESVTPSPVEMTRCMTKKAIAMLQI